MADGHHKPGALSPATSKFIAQLMDPLPDFELADPEMAKLEKRAINKTWETGWMGYRAAARARGAYNDRLGYLHCAGGAPSIAEQSAREKVLRRELAAHVDRQFELPAPDERAVKWKRSIIRFDLALDYRSGKVVDPRYERRRAAIARDEARLGLTGQQEAGQ